MHIYKSIKPLFLSCKILILSSFIIGCVDIQGPEREPLEPGDVLSEIKIRSNAIMIANGDSLQIPFDIIATNNDLLPVDLEKIRWKSLEAQVVSVSPSGVVKGLNISNGPIFVAVQYSYNDVTRHDTVSVYVTNGRIDANELKLIALDSTRVGGVGSSGGTPRVRIDLYKDGFLVEKGALIPIQVDAPATATAAALGGPDGEPVYHITNQRSLLGKFWIRSSLNLYGNEVNDSISFTGLYGDFVLPAISAYEVSPGSEPPIPILDTIALRTFQLCAPWLILNLSMETIDVVFSDSTAQSTDCDTGDSAVVTGVGLPAHGIFIGGNVTNMPPFSAAVRKSRTAGIISYSMRKSSDKQLLPWFASRMEQQDVQD